MGMESGGGSEPPSSLRPPLGNRLASPLDRSFDHQPNLAVLLVTFVLPNIGANVRFFVASFMNKS